MSTEYLSKNLLVPDHEEQTSQMWEDIIIQ